MTGTAKHNELPKSRRLWRVTGSLECSDGTFRPQKSDLLNYATARTVMLSWGTAAPAGLGIRDTRCIVDADAVAAYEKEKADLARERACARAGR